MEARMDVAGGEGRIATLRGALVALHLAAITVIGLPEPQVDPEDLKKPEVQAWFDRTTRQLASVGLEVPRETVVDESIRWGGAWLQLTRFVFAPARTYATWSGTQQSWRMFGDVPDSSAVFFIEARIGGKWVEIHRQRFGEVTWRRTFWDQERVRAFLNQFNRKKSRASWDRLARYLREPLAADFPDATEFRIGMRAVQFPAPDVLVEKGDVTWGERFWVTPIARPEGP